MQRFADAEPEFPVHSNQFPVPPQNFPVRLHREFDQKGQSVRTVTHRGPEHNRSTSEAEYIDAALTFALSELHLAPHGRAIHIGTIRPWRADGGVTA